MTNADKFKQIFGLYATELWSKTEGEFLIWLNSDFNQSDVLDTNGDDTISRQAALNIRFSDAINEDGVLYVPLRDFTNGLKALPSAQSTVDAVEVVRCKDCKFYNAIDHSRLSECEKGFEIYGDDFCSYGERK